jgi:hypothetical protein
MFRLAHHIMVLMLITILGLSGCGPLLATSLPPQPAGYIETLVAMTYAAISSQTAAVLPTATITPTNTPTPTRTPAPPTETPTPTVTFIFVFKTPTTYYPPRTATTETDFACQFVSQKPSNGTTYKPLTDFDWKWKITNTGYKEWDSGSIDYVYVRGDKFSKENGYDFPEDVKPGKSVELVVDMTAPKTQDSYTTTWALRVNKSYFCYVSLNIVVAK